MNKKIISIALTLLLAISITGVALASSYSTSYSFDTTLRGITRSFNGTNITFSTVGSYTNPNPQPIKYPTTFSVSLYRDNGWMPSDFIGTSTLPRTGNGSATWTNVGSGNYFVHLSKAFDGVYVICDNVTISN